MMKHYKTIISCLLLLLIVSCETRTYEEISEEVPAVATVNYTEHIEPIMANNCVVCHSSTGIMSSNPFETYNHTKNSIDKIIDRIERPNGDPQKMPQNGALSQANINLIKQWKTDGLLQ